MFRMWAKIWENNRMIKDVVICDKGEETRTKKILHALDEVWQNQYG